MKQSVAMFFFYSVGSLFFAGLAKKSIIPITAAGASCWFQSWTGDAGSVGKEPFFYDAAGSEWTLEFSLPLQGDCNRPSSYSINGKLVTSTALTSRFSRAHSYGNGNGYD